MERPAETTYFRYPAPGHVLRYVRLALDARGGDVVEGLMPALPDLADAGGGIRLGALTMLVDYVAGVTALRTVQPDWTVTHDLALHLVQPAPPVGELEAFCRVTRAGRNNVSSETSVVAPGVGEVARAFVTFTRLPRREDTPAVSQILHINLAEPLADERPRIPLDEAVGFRLGRGDEGPYAEFDHTDFVVNSVGAIQGGVVALALERAASWAGECALGVGCRATDLHLHYLALGKTGPFRARAEVLRVSEHSVVSRVALHDTGDGDRLLALGVATAERVA
jgi:acyl-coenzyme A thioesterase PaaI-like protein